MAAAIYGLIGVLLGSATTVVLTVYQERRVSTREREARQHRREQDREDQRNAFQRQSLVDLQDAVSDLVKAVFKEQDRMLTEMGQTGNWPARQWETPTATGWVDAELRLQVFRARVFDEVLRDIARKIRALGMESVWASHADEAKALGGPLEQEHARFNELIANALRKFS
jgi:cell division protein FtsL